VRHVLGGRQPRPKDGQTGGKQAKGAVRANASHLRVCHQHDRRQRSKTVRVSDLQKTTADGSQVRGFNRFRDGQQSETLDVEGCRSVVRYKINSTIDIELYYYLYVGIRYSNIISNSEYLIQ